VRGRLWPKKAFAAPNLPAMPGAQPTTAISPITQDSVRNAG
jgi:hypothetical protein